MSDLTEFLFARIAEDEAQAREAIAERKRVTRDGDEPDDRFAYWPDLGAPAVVVGGERVIAECEAKRRIVEEAQRAIWFPYIRFLAAVYSDHPDYREEWKP